MRLEEDFSGITENYLHIESIVGALGHLTGCSVCLRAETIGKRRRIGGKKMLTESKDQAQ